MFPWPVPHKRGSITNLLESQHGDLLSPSHLQELSFCHRQNQADLMEFIDDKLTLAVFLFLVGVLVLANGFFHHLFQHLGRR